MPDSPTVFIIDDDAAVRKSLAYLIESEGWSVRTFELASGFLEAVPTDVPGCIITDVRMPGISGLELQRRLVASGRQMPIIIITAYGDIPSAVEAVKRGAVTFLEKPVSGDLLVDYVRKAIEQDEQSRKVRAERAKLDERLSRLTPREHEVFEMMVRGSSSRQIAAKLGLSHKTVESHRSHILEKMEVGSVSQLIHLTVARQAASVTS
jgi:FixJ family two-component response regulator